MSYQLSTFKIKSMSSLDIAELTGKRHADVLRDIRNMLSELYGCGDANAKMRYDKIQGVTLSFDSSGRTSEIKLDEEHTLTLVTGYSHVLRKRIISRWRFLEEQLRIVQFKEGDKKHQLSAMEALQGLLPEDIQGEPLSFIKANTVVNKAVSNLFGFPKMLNKNEMSFPMLEARERVLDDYLKLYEVIEDNSRVKDLLYDKYQPRRLEVKLNEII